MLVPVVSEFLPYVLLEVQGMVFFFGLLLPSATAMMQLRWLRAGCADLLLDACRFPFAGFLTLQRR